MFCSFGRGSVASGAVTETTACARPGVTAGRVRWYCKYNVGGLDSLFCFFLKKMSYFFSCGGSSWMWDQSEAEVEAVEEEEKEEG